jgi:hypothetical protein
MPYSPVTFAALPVQRYSERTVMPNAQTPQALTLDANFDHLNAELAQLPTAGAVIGRTISQEITTGYSDGAWTNFGSGDWPRLVFTVPECTAVIGTVGCRAAVPATGSYGIWIAAAATGNAFVATNTQSALRMYVRPGTGGHSATHVWLSGADIRVGGTIVLQPQYLLDTASTKGITVAYGLLGLTAVL